MKNIFLKKTAVISLITLSVTGINPISASAAWKINDADSSWSWIENDTAVTGWQKIDGGWYYFNQDGTMYTGWLKDNNKWYKLSDSGNMVTGWIPENDKWYYANPSGELQTGRLTIDGKPYNFLSDGTMVKDEKVADFSNDSVLANRTTIPDKDEDISNESKNEKEEVSEAKEESTEVAAVKDNNFEPRTTQPDLDDSHYYSDENIFYKAKLSPPFTKSDGSKIKGNCTWYTWGRAWEITGEKPLKANFTGNACEWWQANKSSGKYKYGKDPKVGAIAVWNSSLPGSGGCGHVAVVEKIDNGKIYISESMWHGGCFAYKPIYSTEYLAGYIYLDEPNY